MLDIIKGRLMMILIGICIGMFVTTNLYNKRALEILYISEEEIMALEDARLKSQPMEKQQLFYGKPQEAVSMIADIALEYNKLGKRVIFSRAEVNAVTDVKVRSISEDVYKIVLERIHNS